MPTARKPVDLITKIVLRNFWAKSGWEYARQKVVDRLTKVRSFVPLSRFWLILCIPYSDIWYISFHIVLFCPAKTSLGITRASSNPWTDATLGPYGPYRDWPLKTGADEGDQGVPGAPAHDTTNIESGHVDPVTSEALAPLLREGSPRDPTANPTTKV
jgi:hypothetical protein